MSVSKAVPVSLGSKRAKNQENEWQTRDDADKIKRYAELRQDQSRHSKAMNHIMSEHKVVMGLGDTVQPRTSARAGRKRSARKLSRA